MANTVLGRTGLTVNRDAFGALPIQRVDITTAGKILLKALDGGINFFDTARGYTDSEEKIGASISKRRNEFILATKTPSKNAEGFWKDLETSLSKLKTDHIDIYQFHNPDFIPKPDDGTGLYEAMLEAKKQGKIRFIGITNHKLNLAKEAVESGLYDTLQFPFSYLSSEQDIGLTKLCAEKNVGFIAMKALSGGLITDIYAARNWMAQYANVVPIWGIQRETELDELLEAMKQTTPLTSDQKAKIAKDHEELAGDFCRGCGYCLPCPAEISINICARINLLLKRAPEAAWVSETWQQNMARIENCLHCGHCTEHCPYGLDTPALLQKSLKNYREFVSSRQESA
ncbi:aldo/keto reductase [Spirochaetia bacterium]|nr:aldo/keto reductase [Spirochaetia bacterium]